MSLTPAAFRRLSKQRSRHSLPSITSNVKPDRVGMDEFDDAYRAGLDAICRRYEQALERGEQWALVPYEITKQWLDLQSREQLTAAEAAELVRACDRWQGHEFGLPFFAMCNSVRK